MARTLPSALISNYTCRCAPIIQSYPSDAVVKTGFVGLVFNALDGGEDYITIGNKSYQKYFGGSGQGWQDRPFVKSFKYDFQDSASADVTIIDSGGGQFNKFINAVPKKDCGESAIDKIKVTCNFGWVYVNCKNEVTIYDLKYAQSVTYTDPDSSIMEAGDSDPRLTFLIKEIDIATENGFFVYNLKLLDVTLAIKDGEILKSSKENQNGTEQNKMAMLDAISKNVKGCKPDLNALQGRAVRTIRIPNQNICTTQETQSGKVLNSFAFSNSDGGKNGPKGIWNPDNQNGIDANRSMLNSLVTDKKKGTFFVLDSRSKRPFLYVVEDNSEGECLKECSPSPIATYIVNGGNNSPVIAFNPKVKIIPVAAAGGIGNNPTGSDIPKENKDECGNPIPADTNQAYGVETIFSVPADNMTWRSPASANAKEFEAAVANSRASYVQEVPATLEADLVLIGDPWYACPLQIVASYLTIVFLEPYGIGTAKGVGCNWNVTNTTVNPMLSQKNYIINNVSHSIEEDGKFTTTLRLGWVPASSSANIA